MLKKTLCRITCLALLFFLQNVYALDSDNQQPLNVDADSANLNHKTGINIYKGNVKLVQGTTVVTANLLVTYTNHKHKLEKAIAYGNKEKPATYSTLPDNSQLVFNAQALTIEYYPDQSLVKFIDDALATQGKDSYAGPEIDYTMNTQTVISPPSPKGQTTIILQPDQQAQK